METNIPAKALEERPLNVDNTAGGKRVGGDTSYEGKENLNGNRGGRVLGLGLRIGEASAMNNGDMKTNEQRKTDGNGVKATIPVPASPELGSSDPMALLFESQVDLSAKYANAVAEDGADNANTDVDRAATSVSASASTPQRTAVQIADYTAGSATRDSRESVGLKSSIPIPMTQRCDSATSLSSPRDRHQQDKDKDKDSVPKLSAAKIQELTSSPESLCLRPARAHRDRDRSRSIALPASGSPLFFLPEDDTADDVDIEMGMNGGNGMIGGTGRVRTSGNGSPQKRRKSGGKDVHLDEPPEFLNSLTPSGRKRQSKTRTISTPGSSNSQLSTPVTAERQIHTWSSRSKNDRRNITNRLPLETIKGGQTPSAETPNPPSPTPISIPIPPFSIPTYLQLELSSERPSPLYIHQSTSNDFPYESSRVKLERLLNFLLVPLALEQVLCFGTLACLDNWLHSFTILPLRFGKSIFILLKSWAVNLGVEAQELWSFVVKGVGRVWRRRRSRRGSTGKQSAKPTPLIEATPPVNGKAVDHNRDADDWREPGRRRHHSTVRHRRTKSIPSALMPDDKADIIKGLLMICTCLILMRFDASRVYHWIRGQAAIKLYVIYNVLEVRNLVKWCGSAMSLLMSARSAIAFSLPLDRMSSSVCSPARRLNGNQMDAARSFVHSGCLSSR